MSIKTFKRQQGIVANTNLESISSRQFFFQADPSVMEAINSTEAQDFFSGGDFFEFDPTHLLKFLPDEEAEIVYLIYIKNKNQIDVGSILDLTQPTISSKYNRALLKLRYLSLIHSINLRQLLSRLPGISPDELEILYNLFFTANQEFTAKKFFIVQSRVRYIFKKYMELILELEIDEPLKYANLVGIFYFLRRFMRLRIHTGKRRNGRGRFTGDTGPSQYDIQNTVEVPEEVQD